MKISEIDLWHVAIPLPDIFWPSWIPGFPQTENRFTLIRLRTESGIEGFSAGPAMGTEREGLGSLLGPYLLGERADDIPSIRQRVREMGYLGMRVGWLEPACWDIVGKARRRPVYELLGGKGGQVRLYASTGEVKTGNNRIREVEQRLAEGFTAVKLRVHDRELEDDLLQLRETRRGVGDKVVMGVDANQGWRVAVVADAPRWDFDRALRFCGEAHALGYGWVEEPLAMDDYAGQAQLRAQTEIDIAGGELNNQGLPEFTVMLEKKCYDVYQPDAVFTGGMADTWRIIQRVKKAGAVYTPHTWTNGIGFAINLQLHAASPFREESLLEYPYNPPGWLPQGRDGLLETPWLHNRGMLDLPTGPGLGFSIRPSSLRKHAHHFFRGTKLRVAVKTVLDKGISIAKLAGDTRDGRLRAREEQLQDLQRQGRDVVMESLQD